MYFDLALLTIPYQILKDKLILYHHVSCLPVSAIARKTIDLQRSHHFPGLFKQVEKFLIESEIDYIHKFSKLEKNGRKNMFSLKYTL